MSNESPLQLILGVFASADRAIVLRDKLRAAERSGVIGIPYLTAMQRDDDGTLHLVEVGADPGQAGSLAAILHFVCAPGGTPSDRRRLADLAQALPNGSSAIAVLLEHRWVDEVRELIESAETSAVTGVLTTAIAGALDEGRDLVLTAGAADWRTGTTTGAVTGPFTGLSELTALLA